MPWTVRLVVERVRWAAKPVGLGTAAFVAAWPLVTLVHELIVAVMAGLQRAVATFPPLRHLLFSLPFDPIYTGAALEMFGQIELTGIAVVSPAGDLLHAVFPALFVSPEVARGGWALALISSTSTQMATVIATLVANAAMIGAGILLVRRSLRRASPSALRRRLSAATVFGVLLQLDIAGRIFASPPLPSDVETLGLSFAFGVLFPTLTGRRLAISDLQTALSGPLFSLLLAAAAVVAVYAAALVVLGVLAVARRPFGSAVGGIAGQRPFASILRGQAPRLVPLAIGFLAAVFLIGQTSQSTPAPAIRQVEGSVAEAPVAALPSETPFVPLVERAAPPAPSVAAAEPVVIPAAPPSVVRVTNDGFRFGYTVNGERQFIRGMGYNPIYAEFDRDQRTRRYDRDFALMRQSGVNTVFGWTNAEFDDLVLDKAEEHRLGVAMPYHLPPAADYTNPALRAELSREVLEWVASYRRYAALRMWSIGNEVLHKVVFPSWAPLTKNSAQALAKAKAFAAFYVELVDRVHEVDPDHPIILRDAEDAYVTWIREALVSRIASRPYFIYGVNIYTGRLRDVVESWPKQKLEAPLLISEFAPGGLSAKDRPDGYRRMWDHIRGRRDWTIGGVPYVWTTAGPEEVDRAFGLVDAGGKPVDGSLAAIGTMFRATAD